MYRERKRRKVVFIILAVILCIMGIGYSAFYSEFRISGITNITSNWDVKISNISSPTINGSAEEVINPSCDISGTPKSCGEGLSADMEVNLYEAGDSVEYDITITNYGSIDAKLDDYIISGETEAIKVTFSGHTKGETLFKSGSSGDSKTIHVKIEYNPEYTGGEVTEETSISFEYKQADVKELDEDEVISKDRYLVIYNCTENGGEECTSNNEYLLNNENIDLTKTASKEGYEFIGWNTDKDATSSIQNLKVNDNTTLYAIYKKDINITYEIEGIGIKSISKSSDTCTIYNNDKCTKNLPTITLKNTNYSIDGFYIEDIFIGGSGGSYNFTNSASVKAKANVLPIMMTGANFQTKIASVKSSITNIEFIDKEDTNINIPTEIDNETVWDVSADGNESVIAFTKDGENTKTLYIASMGKTIGNSNCQKLFYTFTNITSIEFNDHFDTSRVTNMSSMFYGCTSLTELDVSNFDTSNVTTMGNMFRGCSNLIELNLSNFDTSNVTYMGLMFWNCSTLSNVNLSSFNTSKVTDMSGMFNGCNGLIKLDLSSFNTSNVTVMGNSAGSNGMFSGCKSLTSLDVSGFDTSKVTNMDSMFSGCTGLTELDVSNFDTSNVTTMGSMFIGCSGLRELDVSTFDTSKVTNMGGMFRECRNLQELDLSNFDTSNVTSMYCMFRLDNNLVNLNLSSFDTSKVTNMGGMFDRCSNLTMLDLSSFNTSNVTIMGNSAGSNGMFSGCKSLTSLDVSGFDTSKVTNMDSMFSGCTGLTELDVSNFDTSNVTTMGNMFIGCSGLVELDLTNFNTESLTGSHQMFRACTNLKTIYVSDKFDVTNVTDSGYMFYGCSKLVGGNGTIVTSIDATNARIDGILDGEGNPLPGYFTDGSIPMISTINTSNTITASIKSRDDITKYEFSIDGVNYYEQNDSNIASNIYTFNGLNNNTDYTIYAKITDENSNVKENSVIVKTAIIDAPAFTESYSGDTKNITIIYPSECTSTYSCTYRKNNGSNVTVNQSGITVPYTSSGNISASVSDGTNEVSNSYVVTYKSVYVKSDGNDLNDGSINSPYLTLNKAYQMSDDSSTIYLMDDITLDEKAVFNSEKDITLTSNGNIKTMTRDNSLNGYLITLEYGNISFQNIVIDGNDIESDSLVRSLTTFNIGSNVTIKRGKSTSFGGAINIGRGVTTIGGGSIIENSAKYGGGIYVGSLGKVNINSGNISNNIASINSGGLRCNGICIMNGGRINNNESKVNGSIGIYGNGTFTRNSGEICENDISNSYETSNICSS